jgi:photosystem II stability/assembly factor-like uncharacterized protein
MRAALVTAGVVGIGACAYHPAQPTLAVPSEPRNAARAPPLQPRVDPALPATWSERSLTWEPVKARAPAAPQGWTSCASGTTEKLVAVFGTSERDVWIGGDQGTVLRTGDRGNTFARTSLGEPVVAIWAAGPEDVWVVGAHHVHRVLRGTSLATLSVDGEFYRASGTSALDVWIAGGPLLHTADGGVTWSQPSPNNRVRGTEELYASSPLDVWASVVFGVVHSVDGGKTWQRATLVISVEEAFRLRGSADDVWIVGYNIGPARSTDGGATWQNEDLPGLLPMAVPFWTDLWSAGGGWAWAATSAGVWVRPGRLPWARILGADDIVAVWSTGPLDTWAVGQAGRILRTR